MVWTLVREHEGMVELAAAGRRLVVPRADVYRVQEQPPREAEV